MKFFVRRRDNEMAGQPPWYLGFVSYDPRINEKIMTLIPFNFVVSALRWTYFRLVYGLRLDKPLLEAYAKGKNVGYHNGRSEGYRDGILDGKRLYCDRLLASINDKQGN